jgi:hypothetical protein
MTDVDTNSGEAPVQPEAFIAKIELKSGCGEVEINFDDLPIETYKMLLIEGAKAFINSVGMSKKLPGLTKLEGADKEKAIAAVREQAEENVRALKAGATSKGRAKAAKVSGAEATEAMRLAKILVKDHIRSVGQKIGAYSAKEITAYAKQVLEGNPELMVQARKNLEARANEAKGIKGLDIFALAGDKAKSDEVKAKPKGAPKRKAKGDKAPLSATQAGQVAPRQKPAGATAH